MWRNLIGSEIHSDLNHLKWNQLFGPWKYFQSQIGFNVGKVDYLWPKTLVLQTLCQKPNFRIHLNCVGSSLIKKKEDFKGAPELCRDLRCFSAKAKAQFPSVPSSVDLITHTHTLDSHTVSLSPSSWCEPAFWTFFGAPAARHPPQAPMCSLASAQIGLVLYRLFHRPRARPFTCSFIN